MSNPVHESPVPAVETLEAENRRLIADRGLVQNQLLQLLAAIGLDERFAKGLDEVRILEQIVIPRVKELQRVESVLQLAADRDPNALPIEQRIPHHYHTGGKMVPAKRLFRLLMLLAANGVTAENDGPPVQRFLNDMTLLLNVDRNELAVIIQQQRIRAEILASLNLVYG